MERDNESGPTECGTGQERSNRLETVSFWIHVISVTGAWSNRFVKEDMSQ